MPFSRTYGRYQLWLLALVAGLLSASGFAPFSLWPITLLAFAFLLWLLVRYPNRGLSLGWWFGFGHFLGGLGWIATAFFYQAAMPAFFGWLAVVGLSAFLGCYPAVAGWATGRLARGRRLSTIFLFAGFFTLAELGRGLFFSGFAWNPLGAVFLPVGGIAQLATLIGAPGLGALVVLTAGVLLMLVLLDKRRGEWIYISLLPLLALGAIGGPFFLSVPGFSDTKVMLVQPATTMEEKLAPDGTEAVLRKLARITMAASEKHPDVAAIIWPEGAIEYALEEEAGLRAELSRLLQPDQYLISGSAALHRDESGKVEAAYNSIHVLGSDARIVGRYDKVHLVPGGEYLPLRSIAEPLGLSRLVPGAIDYWPGAGHETLHLPGLPAVGPNICYEVIFPAAVVSRRDRPVWILTVSNDAWFGRTGPPQHFAQARLRAIEEGLPVLRGTLDGISGVISARGEVLDSMEVGEEGVIVANIPHSLPPTLFARFGLLLPFGLAVFLSAVGIWIGKEKTGI